MSCIGNITGPSTICIGSVYGINLFGCHDVYGEAGAQCYVTLTFSCNLGLTASSLVNCVVHATTPDSITLAPSNVPWSAVINADTTNSGLVPGNEITATLSYNNSGCSDSLSPLVTTVQSCPPVITADTPFVCTGQQTVFEITFPQGVPQVYNLILPNGWTLVSKTIIDSYNVQVVVIPNNQGGFVTVSYGNYNVTFQFINDCFIANCAVKLLMSAFCNDTDPCCRECDEYKKDEKRVQDEMMNKAIGLITTYSLAKQNYFFNCNASFLPNLQTLLTEIQAVLIRCNICSC